MWMYAGLNHFETYQAMDNFLKIEEGHFQHPLIHDYNCINACCNEIGKGLNGKIEFASSVDFVKTRLHVLGRICRDIITNNQSRSRVIVPPQHEHKTVREKLIIIAGLVLKEILEEGSKLREAMKQENDKDE